MKALEKIYHNYAALIGDMDTGKAKMKLAFVWDYLNEVGIDKKQEIKFDELLGNMAGAYEEQGFIAGFKHATSIWKECV